jgi:hypothetical protein
VLWRNPKIHDASRVKTWAACEEHRDYLVDYVAERGFYLETKSAEQSPTSGEEQ